MKITFKSIAEHLLFAANIFIIFLLVFADKIDIPYWLKPIGRMHPMILHFPIVLLFLAMLMEFFRFKSTYAKEQLYQNFTSGLLLSGTFLSAITVIMGLFLAQEDGYSGTLLQWHKWTGVSIVFVASVIYWCRKATWYKLKIARLGALITTLCLVAAGHYGASLTHGENFILEPVTFAGEFPKIPVEQAKIFDDVIMPIFSQKCLSCHNVEKAKGGLTMDNLAALLKGGKSGKLFVPGNPKISLLLERIHLPEENKKHMPPKGKNQLTDEEIALLTLWIKENAETRKKVIDLPLQDSLRILATSFLGSSDTAEETYDFEAADQQTIEKLNNNYRGVYTVAKGSPALDVNIYNQASYNANVLKDLAPVKRQIVSLDLNAMPVKDEELKTIAGFENLRTLNLNFTNVTGSGLQALQTLKFLNELSLSGTKLNPVYLKSFGPMRSLKKLVVWNTPLSEANIKQLEKAYPGIEVIAGFKDDGKHPLMLNKPGFGTETTVFQSSLTLALEHPINGVQIRYTTDGTEPDSLKSNLYKQPLLLKENTTIKAKAYKAGWYGSETVSTNVYKSGYKADTIIFLQGPDDKYKLGGSKILADGQLGDFETNSGKWLGFKNNNMEALLVFKKPVDVQSVGLNFMQLVPTYIFPPVEVEVWGGKEKNKLRLLGKVKPQEIKKNAKREFVKVEAKFKAQNVSYLKIVANNLKKLPDWHPGKGEPAWIFVDEVFLN